MCYFLFRWLSAVLHSKECSFSVFAYLSMDLHITIFLMVMPTLLCSLTGRVFYLCYWCYLFYLWGDTFYAFQMDIYLNYQIICSSYHASNLAWCMCLINGLLQLQYNFFKLLSQLSSRIYQCVCIIVLLPKGHYTLSETEYLNIV